MAKISFEMDTNDKNFSITLDGKKIDDVSSISIYRRNYDTDGNAIDEDDDLCHVEIVRFEDEVDGIRRMERICASEKGIETKVETVVKSEVATHIAKFINSRRKTNLKPAK